MKIISLITISLVPLLNFGQQVDFITEMDTSVQETSGLIWLDQQLITLNDSGNEPILYEIDPLSGNVNRRVVITNSDNEDWEDICYDDTYIGDFGNNYGSRTNLKVYRIPISDYLSDTIAAAEIIYFNYATKLILHRVFPPILMRKL